MEPLRFEVLHQLNPSDTEETGILLRGGGALLLGLDTEEIEILLQGTGALLLGLTVMGRPEKELKHIPRGPENISRCSQVQVRNAGYSRPSTHHGLQLTKERDR
jgi:hypothetical protein